MCDPQDLLDQNPCLTAYPPFITRVLLAEGLCAIATGGFTPPGGLWNPDVPGGIHNPDVPGPITNPDA